MEKENKTMDEVYGDGSKHSTCAVCGFCINCGDCVRFGCGLKANTGRNRICRKDLILEVKK